MDLVWEENSKAWKTILTKWDSSIWLLAPTLVQVAFYIFRDYCHCPNNRNAVVSCSGAILLCVHCPEATFALSHIQNVLVVRV